jgi:hypothetical protein
MCCVPISCMFLRCGATVVPLMMIVCRHQPPAIDNVCSRKPPLLVQRPTTSRRVQRLLQRTVQSRSTYALPQAHAPFPVVMVSQSAAQTALGRLHQLAGYLSLTLTRCRLGVPGRSRGPQNAALCICLSHTACGLVGMSTCVCLSHTTCALVGMSTRLMLSGYPG